MRKLLSWILALAMMLSLAACGGSDSGSASGSEDSQGGSEETANTEADNTEAAETDSGEGVTLTWALWDLESTAYWQALADGYEATHDNVKISIIDLGSTDYMTSWQPSFPAGTASWTWFPSRTSPATRT